MAEQWIGTHQPQFEAGELARFPPSHCGRPANWSAPSGW